MQRARTESHGNVSSGSRVKREEIKVERWRGEESGRWRVITWRERV